MTALAQKAYKLLKKVPKGKVTTYKELAHALNTKAYRAIGQAMKNNPYSFDACPEERSDERVPCHRVVASDGTIGGFLGKCAGIEIQKKKKLLQSEGIAILGSRIKEFHRVLHQFE